MFALFNKQYYKYQIAPKRGDSREPGIAERRCVVGDTAAHPEEKIDPWEDVTRRLRLATQLFDAYFGGGGSSEALQRFVDDEDFRAWAVKQLNNGQVVTPPGRAAELILTQKAQRPERIGFIDVDEAARLAGIPLTAGLVRTLGDVPFPEWFLERAKHGFSLLPGLPVSLQMLREQHPKAFSDAPWPEGTWSEVSTDRGWLMLRWFPVQNSDGKSFPQQKRLLESWERIPTVSTWVYARVVQWAVKGRRTSFSPVRCLAHGLDDGQAMVVEVDPKCRITFRIVGPEVDEPNLHLASQIFRTPRPMDIGWHL